MIRVYLVYKKIQSQFDHEAGPLEFGRGPLRDVPRRVLPDPSVSADQLRIEERPGRRVLLQNLSKRFPVRLADGSTIEPGGQSELALPTRLTMGETLMQVEPASDVPLRDAYQTVQRPLRPSETMAIGRLSLGADSVDSVTLTRWFEAVVSVQRASASSGEFYTQTALAVVELIGLDLGLVLLHRGDDWEVVARHSAGTVPSPEFSRAVLDRVDMERRTFFRGTADGGTSTSLMGVDAVVAAPILGDDDGVKGVVYGARLQKPGFPVTAIRPLEAQLVQVLAAAMEAGFARLEVEADAARRQVQFEQFFTPELARELDRDPSLLEGREREVTILFSDIRGFSRHSERITPRETCQLAFEIMDCLTERVREHGGVVVSYNGDGMMAMWNAPADQPDHAVRACRAALAMQAELPMLDEHWRGRLVEPLRVGIGLNTGRALVGNTGSRIKFMYGPQGHAVNLASRVEGATKYVGVPILITGSTHERLDGAFATRRLCRVRVVGIENAVELFELHAAEADPAWGRRCDAYEQALALFENRRWTEACQTLYPLLSEQEDRNDMPTLSLVGRCIECLKHPNRPFDSVVELDQK